MRPQDEGSGVGWQDIGMQTSADIWRHLVRASVDRRHPWRVVAFCTQGKQGPAARSVILRRVQEDHRRLVFYTDRRTDKLRELAACDRVALLCWDAHHRQQLRMSGRAFVEADAAVVERCWAGVPETAQRDYGSMQPPGSPLVTDDAAGEDFNLALAREHFTVLNVEVAELEFLQLEREQHHRWRHVWMTAEGAWQAQPLVP